MYRTQEEWIQAYKDKKALWIHSGDPAQPHVRLTAGKHSDGFFNSRLVSSDTRLLFEAAWDLVELYKKTGGQLRLVDGIVGPQTGATKLAKLIFTVFVAETDTVKYYFWASPEKREDAGVKSMCFSESERKYFERRTVLLCEDVCTTGGSVQLAAKEVIKLGGRVAPYTLALVNRSGAPLIDGRLVVSLVSRKLPMWDEADCPLCKAGSEAIPAKDNWDKLNSG